MSVSEHDRHQLHTKAEEAMGSDAADTLMSYLPPVGWADVTTKRDLAALEERMDLRFQMVDQRLDSLERRFDQRFDSLERRFGGEFDSLARRFEGEFDSLERIFVTKAELAAQTRTIIMGVAALNLSYGALALGIVQLLR